MLSPPTRGVSCQLAHALGGLDHDLPGLPVGVGHGRGVLHGGLLGHLLGRLARMRAGQHGLLGDLLQLALKLGDARARAGRSGVGLVELGALGPGAHVHVGHALDDVVADSLPARGRKSEKMVAVSFAIRVKIESVEQTGWIAREK